METKDARKGRKHDINPIVAYYFRRFDKVVRKEGLTTRDFWFVWTDDYEPIRLIYEDNIVSVLHRIHWNHNTVSNPYVDEDGRIEAFFWWGTHTPRIRMTGNDYGFSVFVKNFARREEDYQTIDDSIPDYYICGGTKDKHPSTVEYEGWPELE